MENTTAPRTIEVDGISEEFFHLLWSKDELNFGPSIHIPDTVIFKYGQPVTWYFTASNGKIKKKNRNNLLNARIEDAFTKNVLGYDVIATFISFGNIPTTDDRSQSAEPVVRNTIEYLDRKEFQKFLYERFESNSGILQRFIEPKGTKNETIRAIWSPKICLLERAENIYQLHDHRYGLYERCVTYEGPEFYCTSAPLRGPVLAGKIQRLCESIVAHISEVTFAQSQVSRIVLNYKVDSRDKVWLLYSTSIRCSTPPALFGQDPIPNPALVNIDNVLSLPSTVYLNPNRSYDKIKPKKEIHCLSCGGATLEDIRHPMQYKTIIKHYEHILFLIQELAESHEVLKWPPKQDIIESAGGVGFGCLALPTSNGDNELGKPKKMDLTKPLEMDELRIPPILRYIHPKLSARSYQQCRKDPLFLYKTVMLCENCYLIYAEFTTMLLKLGTDLTKLFTRTDDAMYDRTLSSAGMGMGSPTTRGGRGSHSTLNRPSSSDWKAMSMTSSNQKLKSSTLPSSMNASSMSYSHLNPSENHIIAKENSIGLRVNEPSEIREQPNVPPTIRNKMESVHLIAETRNNNYRTLSAIDHPVPSTSDGAVPPRGPDGGSLSQTSLKDYYTDQDIKEMIANRERHFYKEISKNPQLSNQHPLIHLINSQQKLRLADEQSGVLNSNSRNGGEGIYHDTYSKPEDRKKHKYHSYQEPIKFVGPNSSSASALLPIRSKGGKKSSKFMSGNRSLASYASSSTAKSTTTLDQMTDSMKKHSDFLTETLQLVTQMETENSQTDPLMESVGEKGLLLKTKSQIKNGNNKIPEKNKTKQQKINSQNNSNTKAKDGLLESSSRSSPPSPSPSPSGHHTPVPIAQEERKLSIPKEDPMKQSGPSPDFRTDDLEKERMKLQSRHDLAVGATGNILTEGMNRAVKDIIDSEGEEN
jgi:hypothetical protein